MRFFVPLFVVSIAAGAVVACSSSSTSTTSSGCAADPFSCATGTTCAAKDQSGTFACITSGKGAKGSSCNSVAGQPECGDGLTCVQQTAAAGECLSFCDPNDLSTHGCSAPALCRPASLVGTSNVFYVCYVQPDGGIPAPPDAGDSGASDG
jgi:hypothetical protein